jgi:transposase-like protein
MICPKCEKENYKIEMKFISIVQNSPYPLGHYKCPRCGFVVSKKV